MAEVVTWVPNTDSWSVGCMKTMGKTEWLRLKWQYVWSHSFLEDLMRRSLRSQGIEERKLFQATDKSPKKWKLWKPEIESNSVCLCEMCTFVLTIDEKSWGFLNTTIIPPNNVINRTTRIMSFRKSIWGSMIEIGSKKCWVSGPKYLLQKLRDKIRLTLI